MANTFAPGNTASLGRKPGSRNRLQGAFVSALAADFEEHGEGVIRIARIEKPLEYLRLIASTLPPKRAVPGRRRTLRSSLSSSSRIAG